MILYKYGIFAEAVDLPSLVTHISKEDADKSKRFKTFPEYSSLERNEQVNLSNE